MGLILIVSFRKRLTTRRPHSSVRGAEAELGPFDEHEAGDQLLLGEQVFQSSTSLVIPPPSKVRRKAPAQSEPLSASPNPSDGVFQPTGAQVYRARTAPNTSQLDDDTFRQRNGDEMD